MRIIAVGATGTLGSAVTTALEEAGHTVTCASRSSDLHVDLTDVSSILAMYESAGAVDAVVCAAGVTPYAPLTEASLDDYRSGIDDKLLGQIELVRQGLDRVTDGGSFTLVSGILAHDPIRTGTVASTVNGALDAFVRAAAIEMPRRLRINAVSPTVLEEAWDAYGSYFPGHRPVAAREAARAYVKSVDGAGTGQVIAVGY